MNPDAMYQHSDALWLGWLAAAACNTAIDTLNHGDTATARGQLRHDLNAFLRSAVATQELKETLKGR
jgi:hypothetical protein